MYNHSISLGKAWGKIYIMHFQSSTRQDTWTLLQSRDLGFMNWLKCGNWLRSYDSPLWLFVRFLTTKAKVVNTLVDIPFRVLETLWPISYHQRSGRTRHSVYSTSLLSFMVDAPLLSLRVKCCHWPLLLWVLTTPIEIKEPNSVAVFPMITPCHKGHRVFKDASTLLSNLFSILQSREYLLSRIAGFGKNRTKKDAQLNMNFRLIIKKNSINLAEVWPQGFPRSELVHSWQAESDGQDRELSQDR